jgi:hypothetical protein
MPLDWRKIRSTGTTTQGSSKSRLNWDEIRNKTTKLDAVSIDENKARVNNTTANSTKENQSNKMLYQTKAINTIAPTDRKFAQSLPKIVNSSKVKDAGVGELITQPNAGDDFSQQDKKLFLENMKDRELKREELKSKGLKQGTADLLSKIYRKQLNNGKNIVDSTNVIQSSIGRAMGQQPSDRGKLLKVPENMKDNLRRFKDGYQFGDITATALENFSDSATTLGSTALEIPTRIAKGIFSVSEGMANAGASAIAGAADLIGQDEYANALRKRIAVGTPFTKTHNLLESTADKLNTNSFSGKLLDSATEGVGQSGGQMAVGAALGKFGEVPIKFGDHVLNMPTTAFATGMGSAAAETYAKADEQLGGLENATGKEKLQMALRILGGGAIEGTTEGLFGLLGVGGTDITDEFAQKAVARAENAFQKQLTKILVAGGGEAAEEFISYAGNYLMDNYANKFGKLDFSEKWNWDDVMQEMASAFISSGISQGATSAIQINKVTQNAVQLAETEQGRQLTPQEISEIRNSVADEVLGAREELESLHKDTNISENSSNIDQISQKNVQNVSNLESNQQMSISDEQNNQATVTNEIQTFVENRNKIAPGLNVEMDNTLKTDGVIIKNSDGTRTMKINPNSTRAYEFVAVHEMLHDLEGTQEYSELQKYVQDRATSHENYEHAKQKITEQYENFYKNNNLDMSNLDMNVETVNDMVAQSLGNQQFLNELAGNKPNVFMKMYNWVKNVLFDGQNTGKTFNERRTDNKYLQELKRKFERAYNTVYQSSAGKMYDIITTKDNKRFVKASRQVIQGNDVSNWGKQIKKYINEEIRKGQDVSVYGEDGTLLSITADTAGKATFRNEVRMSDGTTRLLTDNEYKSKLEAESHVDELAQVSKHKNGPVPDTKNHSFAKDGFNYRTAYFEDSDGKYYKITISVGKNGAINTIYNVGQMKEMQKNRSDTSNRGLKGPNGKTANGSITSKYSIPSSDSTVNNQYMQNNEKNSQGLENSSSFSLSKDNKGRTLSREQQEYFKDSKVRDENGNLKVMYHGTDADFNTFSYDYLGKTGLAYGKGFYFTDNAEAGQSYGKNLKQVYLDVKKPMQAGLITMTRNDYSRLVKELNEITNGTIEADYGSLEDAISEYDYGGDDIDLISAAQNISGIGFKRFYNILRNILGYDGIIANNKTNGHDGNIIIVFNSNQIKSVDNTKPTSNPDIRYSQSNNEWSKYLKENWDLMPNSKKTFGFPTNERLQAMDNKKISESADLLNMKEKKIKSLEEIANMTENDARMENGVNYKHKKDKNTPYQRKFFENAETSKVISQEVKDSIDITTYERQSNEQTLEKAKIKLDEQGDKLIKQWETKTKNFTAEDVAIGAILIERYQQMGDTESAVNVVQKLADMGTEVGRAVQMFSIFQRLTPEAMMVYQQRKLNDVFKEISQRKTGEWVEANKEKFKLTAEDSKFITEQVEKAQQATSEREKQIELAKIEKRINDKLPPERGQTIKAIRRMAMLFNPKTQVRNVVGNALIMPVNDVADIIGTQIDKLIAKKTGVRTTNYADLKEKSKGFKKGITEAVQDYKMGIRTEPSGSKYEFDFGGKSFNENTKSKALNAINNKLNGIENLLGAVMSGGDRPFYEAAFNNSLQGQMKANNVTTPTTEMIDIAVNEALSRTWNDSNSYTEAVLGIRRQMNKLNIGGFGLGDLIIPFAKTPANLTKAMVEYSPLGTIEAIINYSDMKKAISRGEMTAQQQKNFVNSTSKAITGSILYLIAGALAQSGAVTGSADDDKDIKNFEQNVLGIQPYSIKIGDKTFTYSWANPLNAPLAIMADTYKMSKEKAGLFDILTNGFKVAGEVVVDNSFLQGIKELFEADSISEGVVNAIVDMPAQFVPTFLSQFATLGDKTKRQTFEYGDKLKSTMNQIKAKIPGAKNILAPTVNTFGEEVENYGGDNSAFNVFLNPANISKANATDTQKELYALYEATKDKTIFPMQAPYYLSDDGEKVNLSSNERSEYQKRSGEYVSKELHALFDSEFYKTLENEDKVEVVNKIVKDANTHAKSKWITTKATEELQKTQDELKDVPMVDYYNAWLAQKDAEGKKNTFGKTISGTKKKAKIKAINEAVDDDLTPRQKKILYGIFNVD